ncbi:MAG: hypothetical protein QMC81_11590 [Thermoanaerobacterales bacterium]|nr:hypothetical protein [Thermoanaerobacterales bacterium]
MEYGTVLLAALLHDIGKFLQKGDFAGTGTGGGTIARDIGARRPFHEKVNALAGELIAQLE